jgi:hypothetical protein
LPPMIMIAEDRVDVSIPISKLNRLILDSREISSKRINIEVVVVIVQLSMDLLKIYSIKELLMNPDLPICHELIIEQVLVLYKEL